MKLKKTKLSASGKKKFRRGSVSAAGFAFVLAAVILLNLLCTGLTDRYDLTLDLTAGKLFEISDDSRTLLQDLSQPVEVTVLMSEDNFKKDSYYSNVYTLLGKYQHIAGDNMTISYIDPYTNPNATERFSDVAATIREGSVVVSCNDKHRVLNVADFYQVEESSYSSSYSVSGFQGEQALTAAITAVTSSETPAVYVLSGHQESVSSDFTTMLTNAGFTADVLNLTETDIPDDASILVISLPQTDYSEEEVNAIDAFIKNGGDVMYFDGTASPTDLPVLYSYLKEWGIDMQADMVLDSDYNISNAPYILASYTDSDYNKDLDSKSDMSLTAPNAKSIQTTDTGDDRTLEVLMESLDTSYAKVLTDDTQYDSYDRADGDTSGPFTLAVMADYTGNDKGGQLFACSSALMMSNDLMEASTLLNYDFLRNVTAQLQPDTTVISIPSKSLQSSPLVIGTTASFIVFMILLFIPAALFICAGFVFFRRRNK